jgi:hypothetical protein
VQFVLLVVGLGAPAIAVEYMNPTGQFSFLRGHTWAAPAFMAAVIIGLAMSTGMYIAMARFMRRGDCVAVEDGAVGICLGLSFYVIGGEPECEIVLRRDELRRVWIISSSSDRRRKVSLPMIAFPTLDRFLTRRLPQLKVDRGT